MSVTQITSVVSPADQRLLDALAAARFSQNPADGWFYPSGDSNRAAVRICVFDGQYSVCRRRRLRSPWMLIVTADTQEFDPSAFNVWRDSWPLTH